MRTASYTHLIWPVTSANNMTLATTNRNSSNNCKIAGKTGGNKWMTPNPADPFEITKPFHPMRPIDPICPMRPAAFAIVFIAMIRSLLAEDLARIAYCMLHEGRWNGSK